MPDVTPQTRTERPQPKTVLAAKAVDLLLVTYTDDDGRQYTQLAIAGDKQVHMMDGRLFGVSRSQTPQGPANSWLRDAIFKVLGRKVAP